MYVEYIYIYKYHLSDIHICVFLQCIYIYIHMFMRLQMYTHACMYAFFVGMYVIIIVDVMQCNAMQCNAMRCNAMQCNV